MSELIIIQNRNQIVRRRKCSYCKSEGHNIKTCSSQNLVLFGEMCRMVKETYIFIDLFINWLIRYVQENQDQINLIRAYACKNCNIRLNSHIHTVIEAISNKTFDLLNDPLNIDFVRLPEGSITNNNLINGDILIFIESFNDSLITKNELKKEIIIIENLIEDNSGCLFNCGVCFDKKTHQEKCTLNCNHMFCIECTEQIIKMKPENPTCAFCRQEIDSIKIEKGSKINL